MPSDNSAESFHDQSPSARSASAALVIAAGLLLIANCLINSPSHFSAKHAADTSLLHPVVSALGLWGNFPTTRGVEIRNLMFYAGAALLALIGAARLMTSQFRMRTTFDEFLDFRTRAAAPYFWWLVLLAVSALSSYFSHAPHVCLGQSIIRCLQFAWWWPLAAMIRPTHVRRLTALIVIALSATAAIGLWYHVVRSSPAVPLSYPIGNELFMGACLLPGVFCAIGLLRIPNDTKAAGKPAGGFATNALSLIAIALLVFAIWKTRARSAQLGLIAGLMMIVLFNLSTNGRKIALVVILAGAVCGAGYIQQLRTQGKMGQRAHSIRSRLNYEWPAALSLFLKKPVGGHGDGAYSLLAGQFIRQEQLNDPGVLVFKENAWPAHAHNEYLELLADTGIIGLIAFVGALAATIWNTLRYSDVAKRDRINSQQRWLAIGLAAALVAVMVEEFSSPAIREPGLAPIFLTVWAALWALTRPVKSPDPQTPAGQPWPAWSLKLVACAVSIAAIALGYAGVQDWRAALARYDASTKLEDRKFAESAASTDFAGRFALDPFIHINDWLLSAWARSADFDAQLRATRLRPPDSAITLGGEAGMTLERLSHAAPHFLSLSHREWELFANLEAAHVRRGEIVPAQQAHQGFVVALEQNRRDEPFDAAIVERLWYAKPQANSLERLTWLRQLIRAGEINEQVEALFRTLAPRDDFVPTLDSLYQIADSDASSNLSIVAWHDPLGPETLRLAALAQALTRELPKAAQIADQAHGMYQHTGPALFAADAAALHEAVRYDFAADPKAHLDKNIERLWQAYCMAYEPITPDAPLAGPLAQTRLRLLIVADRHADAQAQVDRICVGNPSKANEQWAQTYFALALLFADHPAQRANSLRWAKQAAEKMPQWSSAYGLLARLNLRDGNASDALAAAQQFLKTAPDKSTAIEYLRSLRRANPKSPMWEELERSFPQLRMEKPPTTAASPR